MTESLITLLFSIGNEVKRGFSFSFLMWDSIRCIIEWFGAVISCFSRDSMAQGEAKGKTILSPPTSQDWL